MKKSLSIIAFILLVLVSAASVLIKRPDSSALKAEETKDPDGQVIRIDYLDENGQITVASDRQYATRLRTYEGSKMVKEEYLDSKGRETRSASGYSVLKRTYDSEGRADTDTYYNTAGKPARSESGIYGYKRIYDSDDRVIEIDYVDEAGKPMNNISGVAVVRREFYDDGRIKREFYFDKDNAPAGSYAGQYGELREYDEDGRISLITYLDADGNPFRSNRGYATVRNRYSDDGKLYEVSYFDENDDPATGWYRQYGERYIDGQTFYIDRNGQGIKRLDNYLNTHPFVVVFMGICVICIALFTKGRVRFVFAVAYVIFIFYMTLWHRETGYARSRFDLFWSYRQFLFDAGLRQSIINNIWLFVPLGAFLYKPGSKRFLLPVVLSIAIEVIQYFTGIGLCELDDVFGNSIGGFIGYSLAYAFMGFDNLRIFKKQST